MLYGNYVQIFGNNSLKLQKHLKPLTSQKNTLFVREGKWVKIVNSLYLCRRTSVNLPEVDELQGVLISRISNQPTLVTICVSIKDGELIPF